MSDFNADLLKVFALSLAFSTELSIKHLKPVEKISLSLSITAALCVHSVDRNRLYYNYNFYI